MITIWEVLPSTPPIFRLQSFHQEPVELAILTTLTLFLSSPLTILYVINAKKDDLDYDKEKYKAMILMQQKQF